MSAALDTVAEELLHGHPLPGTLYGIGVGPGDPGLLTVRAAALLQRLELVAVPRGARGHGVARQAIAPWVVTARTVELVSDMPTQPERISEGWRQRVAPLLEALAAEKSCAVVSDGDPALYSTFAYAAGAVLAERPQTPVVVVPGVPAMCAAAAARGCSLVLGAERLAVLPASRVDDDALKAALRAADTVVLLKAAAALPRIRALLDGPARGWSVQYARRVGLEGEEHGDSLEALAKPDDYMALVVLRRPPPPAAAGVEP